MDSRGLGRELYGQAEECSSGTMISLHGLVHHTKLKIVPLQGVGHGHGEPCMPWM